MCGITTCMLVSFFVRGCDYFLLCPGGGYSLWWPIRGGSARNPGEVLNKYLNGEAPSRSPALTRRESVLHLWLIPILQWFYMTVRVSSSYVKRVPFVNRRYTKSWKIEYKRLRGGPPPYKKIVEYPPLPDCSVSMMLVPAHMCSVSRILNFHGLWDPQ